MVSPKTFPSLDRAFLAWSFDWYCRCIQLPGDAIYQKPLTQRLVLQLLADLSGLCLLLYLLIFSPCVSGCFHTVQTAAEYRRQRLEENYTKIHIHITEQQRRFSEYLILCIPKHSNPRLVQPIIRWQWLSLTIEGIHLSWRETCLVHTWTHKQGNFFSVSVLDCF